MAVAEIRIQEKNRLLFTKQLDVLNMMNLRVDEVAFCVRMV